MSFYSRIKSIFKAKTNSVLNEIENPEEALELSLVELRQNVDKIKKALLEVTTLKKGLESELTTTKDKIKLTEEQATLAVQAMRDDLAEAALEKKQDLLVKESNLQIEIKNLQEKIQVIIKNKEQLEIRVRDIESKKKELIAFNKAADAELAVKEILTGVSDDMTEITERIDRAERKINTKKSRIAAFDELTETNGFNDYDQIDKIEKELKDIQRKSRIAGELAVLKANTGKE